MQMGDSQRKRSIGAGTGGARLEEEMQPQSSLGVPSTELLFAGKKGLTANHPKKDDDARVPVPADWTTSVEDSHHPLLERRGGMRRANAGGAKGRKDGGGVALDGGGGSGSGTAVNAMAIWAVEQANRLGTERVVLMLLTAVTIVTGALSVLSAPNVFYNNYIYSSWKANSPRASEAVDNQNVSMPDIPPQIIFLEHALWRFGMPAIAVGIIGFLAARARTISLCIYLYVLVATVFALACFTIIGVAFSQHYLADGEADLSQHLRTMWNELAASDERTNHAALCELQEKFACSGFSRCCITNTSVIAEEELAVGLDGHGKAWNRLCFLTMSNGTRVDRHGTDVTDDVNRECQHMITPVPPTHEETSASHEHSANSASAAQLHSSSSHDSTARLPHADDALTSMSSSTGTAPEKPLLDPAQHTSLAQVRIAEPERRRHIAVASQTVADDGSVFCPLPEDAEESRVAAAMSPCQDKLVGNLTSSLGFVLCSLFTLAVFSGVGVGFALVIIREAVKRPLSSGRDADANASTTSIEVVYTAQEPNKPHVHRDGGNEGPRNSQLPWRIGAT